MSRLLSNLPTSITEKGITFKLYIDFPHTEAIKAAKKSGKRYRTIKVLARILRGREDYHGKLYQPHKWIFIEA